MPEVVGLWQILFVLLTIEHWERLRNLTKEIKKQVVD